MTMKRTLILVLLGCLLMGTLPAWAVEFLVNERNASTIYVWDPDAGTETVYHTVQNNDADINVPEGSADGWFVEHTNDDFGRFTPGSGAGSDATFNTPYAYPKHVTVFDGAVFVMSRNDATIYKYDLTGAQLLSEATGNGTGQGMATDGSLLYVSFWNGSNSFFETFDSSLNPVGSFANPTGLPGGDNNVFDFAYDAATGTFYGLSTVSETGTATETSDVVQFTMGGSVIDTFTLSFAADGIGQFANEQVAVEARATFEVNKDFTDNNPNGVEVTISCNTGLPLEQSKVITEGEGVEFVVTEFDAGEMDCEVTETVPAGYEVEYFNGAVTNDIGCAYEDVGFETAFACRITNTPGPVDVVIHKEWVFEGSSDPQGIDQRYELTLWCDAEIVGGFNFGESQEAPSGIIGPFCGPIVLAGQDGPQGFADWCKGFFGEGPETFIAEVIPEFPDSHCFVIERVFDSAVEVDNGCQNITVSAGNGAECTITNTVFFEGIPTLNQYGLALLALLMLGVGFVGFRRLA